MVWSASQASLRPPKNGNVVTRRRVFTLFRSGCVTPDIAASSTPTWRIPHQIPSTGELDIELSQKLSAIALSDVQAERVAAKRMHRRETGSYPSATGRPSSQSA